MRLQSTIGKVYVGLRNCFTASAAKQQDVTWESARPFEEIPSDLILPIIGTGWTMLPFIGRYTPDQGTLAFKDRRRRMGNIYREKIGSDNIVTSFSIQDLAKILKSEGPYPNRGQVYSIAKYRKSRKHLYSDTGLFNLQGKEWADSRKKIQKHLLRPKSIQAYSEQMQDVAKDFILRMFDIRDSNNEIPDLLHELFKFSLEAISLVGLDTRLGCLKRDLSPDSDAMKIIRCVNTLSECLNKLEPFAGNIPFFMLFPTPTWKKFERNSDAYAEIAFKYINKAVDNLKQFDGKKPLSLLQAMLATKDFDEPDVMAFYADMIMGGIEGISFTMAFLLNHLAINPEKQDILYQEVMKQMPKADTKLNPAIFESLKYAKACLKESMRIVPIIGRTSRVLASDLVLSGYRVPAGTIAKVISDQIHMDEKIFKNPEQYLPERWLSTEHIPDPLAFIPFGIGPRSCIAKRLVEVELIALITEIIRNFKIEYHLEDIGSYVKVNLTPDKALRFNFIER